MNRPDFCAKLIGQIADDVKEAVEVGVENRNPKSPRAQSARTVRGVQNAPTARCAQSGPTLEQIMSAEQAGAMIGHLATLRAAHGITPMA